MENKFHVHYMGLPVEGDTFLTFLLCKKFLSKAHSAIALWKSGKIPEPCFRARFGFDYHSNHAGEIPRMVTVISPLVVGALVDFEAEQQPIYQFDACQAASVLSDAKAALEKVPEIKDFLAEHKDFLAEQGDENVM
jgi:hypothetical protein